MELREGGVGEESDGEFAGGDGAGGGVETAAEREDFVPEVQAMRRRVEELVPAGVRTREIKLGTGGLRDVEFAVQLLQLVHGRNDDSLHVASTVNALAALGAVKALNVPMAEAVSRKSPIRDALAPGTWSSQ